MIRSMTGFGRAVQEIDGYVITVELKSVNHRYFEFSSRVPRQYGFIEDKLKSFVNSRVSRGKVDCFVGIEALNTEAAQVAVNHTLAGAYNTALQEIADTYGAKQDWGAAAIARFPDVLVVRKAVEDEDKILTDKANCRARAYDIVLNGVELGGGSIRINTPEMQEKAFQALGISEEDIQERFGHLVNAFKFGAPPHGGLAYGLDRLVMLMTGASSIRDVIAFPKVQNASDLMMNCPDVVDDKQLDDLSIAVTRMEETPAEDEE